jgi:hypothetical protein
MAFAEELPGSLIHIAAQKCDVARLEQLRDQTAYMPPRGDYWVVLVDEADQMSDKAQLNLLSRLDRTASLKPKFGGGFERGTPPKIVFIFTCNGIGPDQTEVPVSLLPRFVSRNLVQAFEAATVSELAAYLEKIWNLEDGPATVDGYFEYIAEGVGVRDALMRLETDLLAGPRPVPAKLTEPAPLAPVLAIHHARKAASSKEQTPIQKAWATRRAKAAAAGQVRRRA